MLSVAVSIRRAMRANASPFAVAHYGWQRRGRVRLRCPTRSHYPMMRLGFCVYRFLLLGLAKSLLAVVHVAASDMQTWTYNMDFLTGS